MKLTEQRLKEIIQEEITEYYGDGNNTRSRIDEDLQRTPNFNRLGRWDHWQDYTDLYNISYRRFHGEEGFNEVKYNEPSNIVLMKPKEGTFKDQVPVAMFGVKRARGLHEDLRHVDSTGYGIKPVRLDDDQYERFLENTYKAVREVNPTYLMNFGLMDPSMELEGEDQTEFTFRKMYPAILSYNS